VMWWKCMLLLLLLLICIVVITVLSCLFWFDCWYIIVDVVCCWQSITICWLSCCLRITGMMRLMLFLSEIIVYPLRWNIWWEAMHLEMIRCSIVLTLFWCICYCWCICSPLLFCGDGPIMTVVCHYYYYCIEADIHMILLVLWWPIVYYVIYVMHLVEAWLLKHCDGINYCWLWPDVSELLVIVILIFIVYWPWKYYHDVMPCDVLCVIFYLVMGWPAFDTHCLLDTLHFNSCSFCWSMLSSDVEADEVTNYTLMVPIDMKWYWYIILTVLLQWHCILSLSAVIDYSVVVDEEMLS
jgi:hypothetical protein